ncbi:hypothetical protein K438DRAFT_1965867 [Mycena galopus ATCC 62051]|nr:hypothetical protein K438DRAFT_1965867 [Mycena galopus ATCC 62051]
MPPRPPRFNKFFRSSPSTSASPVHKKPFPYHLAEPLAEQLHREARERAERAKVESQMVDYHAGFLGKVLVQQEKLRDVGRRVGELKEVVQAARVREWARKGKGEGKEAVEQVRTVTGAVEALREGKTDSEEEFDEDKSADDASARSSAR